MKKSNVRLNWPWQTMSANGLQEIVVAENAAGTGYVAALATGQGSFFKVTRRRVFPLNLRDAFSVYCEIVRGGHTADWNGERVLFREVARRLS